MSNAIGWCDSTINPIVGCTKCGLACAHCYAERMARRLRAIGTRGYADGVDNDGFWTGRTAFVPGVLDKLIKTRKPKRVFMGSMTDLFHENTPDAWRDKIFATMAICPQHTFIVLTKRIELAREYLRRAMRPLGYTWPALIPNVQLLVSIWDQASADAAIPVLLDTPAAVRGVSIEPMLGPMNIRGIEHLDRVVLGGENGPGARPMRPDWVRGVRDQCVDAGVPFWFKGWGEWLPFEFATGEQQTIASVYRTCLAGNGESGDLGSWVRLGKKRSGHILDGREWREEPK
jgi:protein gp37